MCKELKPGTRVTIEIRGRPVDAVVEVDDAVIVKDCNGHRRVVDRLQVKVREDCNESK